MEGDASDESLVARRITVHGESCVGEPPHVIQDPRVLLCLPRLDIGYCLTEDRKDPFLSCWGVHGDGGGYAYNA